MDLSCDEAVRPQFNRLQYYRQMTPCKREYYELEAVKYFLSENNITITQANIILYLTSEKQ
jgi:hypothetical protein